MRSAAFRTLRTVQPDNDNEAKLYFVMIFSMRLKRSPNTTLEQKRLPFS